MCIDSASMLASPAEHLINNDEKSVDMVKNRNIL